MSCRTLTLFEIRNDNLQVTVIINFKDKNLKTITYFIGAGASFHSLPLIKTMGIRMQAFSSYLKLQRDGGKVKKELIQPFIDELDKLIEHEKESTSIDAYAKELTNSNQQMELHRLKMVLSSYFVFEQLIKPEDLVFYEKDGKTKVSSDIQEMLSNPIDKRYRTFWADYINGHSSTPAPNIKVISWNYDMQFEFAFSRLKNYSLELTQQEIQVFPAKSKTIDNGKFCLLKMNGTAGLFKENGKGINKLENYFDLKQHHLNNFNLELLLNIFNQNYSRVFTEPVFSFAWEANSIADETRKIAKEILSKTNILVIIGYSFPSFNRTIDRQLFENIESLEKVYYQAPKNEINELILKLDGINPRLRELTTGIENLATFYVPNEY